jgi:BirA family biotin operon repressor/biotin-[acetyl-CoA-carboxylase] ligase
MQVEPPTPPAALLVLAGAFATWRSVWESEGFAPIARAWTQRAHGLGQTCVARLSTETVEGVAEGLDDGGALRLRTSNGAVRLITAGDVFF